MSWSYVYIHLAFRGFRISIQETVVDSKLPPFTGGKGIGIQQYHPTTRRRKERSNYCLRYAFVKEVAWLACSGKSLKKSNSSRSSSPGMHLEDKLVELTKIPVQIDKLEKEGEALRLLDGLAGNGSIDLGMSFFLAHDMIMLLPCISNQISHDPC